MENRWHINNDRMMIEAPATKVGKEKLESIRKIRPSYKNRKIRKVIQAYPSKIRYYREYRLT